jgi:biotin transport system substrate-specific component
MLAGAVLGRWRGAAAVLVFLLLVALGLPLLAGGRGGLGVFFGPSVGFLVGFPVAAFVIGWLTERLDAPRSLARGIAVNVVGGIAVLYLFGIAGMALVVPPGSVPQNVLLGIAAIVGLPAYLAFPVWPIRLARTVLADSAVTMPGALPSASFHVDPRSVRR